MLIVMLAAAATITAIPSNPPNVERMLDGTCAALANARERILSRKVYLDNLKKGAEDRRDLAQHLNTELTTEEARRVIGPELIYLDRLAVSAELESEKVSNDARTVEFIHDSLCDRQRDSTP